MKDSIRTNLKKIKILYEPWHKIRLKVNAEKEKKKINAFKQYGHDILADVSDVMIKNQIPCICMDGTLLGLVRDNQLIPWDDDLDFVILDTDTFQWNNFEKHMIKAGFWKYRKIEENGKIIMQSYKKKNVLCDFSLWPKSDKSFIIPYGIYEISGYKYINRKTGKYRIWYKTIPPISKIIIAKYANINVQIPINYEEILEALYGINWKYPDPNFKNAKDEKEKEFRFTYYCKNGRESY